MSFAEEEIRKNSITNKEYKILLDSRNLKYEGIIGEIYRDLSQIKSYLSFRKSNNEYIKQYLLLFNDLDKEFNTYVKDKNIKDFCKFLTRIIFTPSPHNSSDESYISLLKEEIKDDIFHKIYYELYQDIEMYTSEYSSSMPEVLIRVTKNILELIKNQKDKIFTNDSGSNKYEAILNYYKNQYLKENIYIFTIGIYYEKSINIFNRCKDIEKLSIINQDEILFDALKNGDIRNLASKFRDYALMFKEIANNIYYGELDENDIDNLKNQLYHFYIEPKPYSEPKPLIVYSRLNNILWILLVILTLILWLIIFFIVIYLIYFKNTLIVTIIILVISIMFFPCLILALIFLITIKNYTILILILFLFSIVYLVMLSIIIFLL